MPNLCLSCTLCFATNREYRMIMELEANEAYVEVLISQIRVNYRDDVLASI